MEKNSEPQSLSTVVLMIIKYILLGHGWKVVIFDGAKQLSCESDRTTDNISQFKKKHCYFR